MSKNSVLGLRDTKFTPDPNRRKPKDDPKLNPNALSPLPQPVLYRSFDWYSSSKSALVGTDFEGANRSADRPVNTIHFPRSSIDLKGAKNEEGELLSLKVSHRYFYKKISEDERECGCLAEVSDESLSFRKFDQGYRTLDVFRWSDLEEVWNHTGQESLWVNEKSLSKNVKESLRKRQGWKKEHGHYTTSWKGQKSALKLDCEVKIKIDS